MHNVRMIDTKSDKLDSLRIPMTLCLLLFLIVLLPHQSAYVVSNSLDVLAQTKLIAQKHPCVCSKLRTDLGGRLDDAPGGSSGMRKMFSNDSELSRHLVDERGLFV